MCKPHGTPPSACPFTGNVALYNHRSFVFPHTMIHLFASMLVAPFGWTGRTERLSSRQTNRHHNSLSGASCLMDLALHYFVFSAPTME